MARKRKKGNIYETAFIILGVIIAIVIGVCLLLMYTDYDLTRVLVGTTTSVVAFFKAARVFLRGLTNKESKESKE